VGCPTAAMAAAVIMSGPVAPIDEDGELALREDEGGASVHSRPRRDVDPITKPLRMYVDHLWLLSPRPGPCSLSDRCDSGETIVGTVVCVLP
jgi:hypothetical protein